MLPLRVVMEIKHLLDERQLSQRQIAERLHVSRGTIQAIASGKRGLHGHEPANDSEPVDAVPERCPGCGALVYMPCILCQARAYSDRRRQPRINKVEGPAPRRVA